MTCYLRSSSLGTLEFCEMKYFFVYVLGMRDKQNKKATLGTIVHRVMQVLGDKRIAKRNNKRKVKNDDIPDLTLKQCDDIPYVTRLCFDYYDANEPTVDLDEADYRQCVRWVEKAIAYNNGDLDPRNQNIHETELFFDIEIKKEWSKFEYVLDGKKISGNLSIKGTVDVIIKEDDVFFRVLDYKGLPLQTPILTTNGWSTMAEIQVGDTIYDRFFKKTKVIGKSQVKNKQCYKITFDDGAKVECDDEHYWKLADDSVVQILDLKIGMEIDIPIKKIKSNDADFNDIIFNDPMDIYPTLIHNYSTCENTRKIVKIEKIGKKETQCISVDSPDSTYLCTKYLIPTHNTGKRLNWATGKEKTYNCLMKDTQLLLYYYALKNLYPDKSFYISIYYINDGGVFDMVFDEKDYIKAENILRQKFEYIRSVQLPQQLSSEQAHWKCQRLCEFSKIDEETGKSVCNKFHDMIKQKGIDWVTNKYADPHKIQNYGDGGGRIAEKG